jgi:hypothetical protein
MQAFIQRNVWIIPAATGALLFMWCGIPAADAGVADVEAYAEGYVVDGHRLDTQTSPGIGTVSANVSYASSPPLFAGNFAASSRAAEGNLGVSAFVSVTDAPGLTNLSHNFFPLTAAVGDARFLDSWTFNNQPLDTPGKLRVTVEFHGSTSANAVGATPTAVGQFEFDLDTLSGLPNENSSYISGLLTNANETAVVGIDFHYGRPVIVDGHLTANVKIDSDVNAFTFSGSALADFSNTAKLVKLEVRDENGQWTTNYSLTTASGAVYPFQAQVVPEPSAASVSLAMIGLFACLTFRTSRRSTSNKTNHDFPH